MARICDLVEEAVEEIMSLLSPESLKQFKCVSKKWYAFINALMRNLAFVAKRLENMNKKMLSFQSLHFSKPTADNCSEEGEERSAEEAHLLLIWANNDARDDFGTEDLKLPFDQTTLDKFHLTGHCNGIICLAEYDREGKILLLNPALREIKTLPSSCLGGEYEVREVGFGYDSGKNDYKVVVIRVFLDNFRAEVHTLSTNSWKEITLDAEFKLTLSFWGSVS